MRRCGAWRIGISAASLSLRLAQPALARSLGLIESRLRRGDHA
jgi:hypothetical protein